MQSSFSDLEYPAKKKQTRRDRFSDEGAEDAVYDSQAIRRFVGMDLNREGVPDATTLLRFRHLLEAHPLTESIFDVIDAHLTERGLFLREGTIVDATLISAPPSTKNKERARDSAIQARIWQILT